MGGRIKDQFEKKVDFIALLLLAAVVAKMVAPAPFIYFRAKEPLLLPLVLAGLLCLLLGLTFLAYRNRKKPLFMKMMVVTGLGFAAFVANRIVIGLNSPNFPKNYGIAEGPQAAAHFISRYLLQFEVLWVVGVIVLYGYYLGAAHVSWRKAMDACCRTLALCLILAALGGVLFAWLSTKSFSGGQAVALYGRCLAFFLQGGGLFALSLADRPRSGYAFAIVTVPLIHLCGQGLDKLPLLGSAKQPWFFQQLVIVAGGLFLYYALWQVGKLLGRDAGSLQFIAKSELDLVQELLADTPEPWHFIGRLQENGFSNFSEKDGTFTAAGREGSVTFTTAPATGRLHTVRYTEMHSEVTIKLQ